MWIFYYCLAVVFRLIIVVCKVDINITLLIFNHDHLLLWTLDYVYATQLDCDISRNSFFKAWIGKSYVGINLLLLFEC